MPQLEERTAEVESTSELTLTVEQDAPLDESTLTLKLPWGEPDELIEDAFENVGELKDEPRDRALDIYLGEDGLGLGKWASTQPSEWIRGTSAPHDGLPSVGEARSERLKEARDDALPEHPVVDFLRNNPELGVVSVSKHRKASLPVDSKMEPQGVRYLPEEETFQTLITVPIIGKTTNTYGAEAVSKWAYKFLHYDEISPTVTANDALWFEDEGE